MNLYKDNDFQMFCWRRGIPVGVPIPVYAYDFAQQAFAEDRRPVGLMFDKAESDQFWAERRTRVRVLVDLAKAAAQ